MTTYRPIAYRRIAETARANCVSVVTRWLPRGKRQGMEWCALNPRRNDRHIGSFRILVVDGVASLDNPRSFDFKTWDPTAKSDMQALKDVFDTNHDGKLDPGDADWSQLSRPRWWC